MAILHKNITASADIHNPKWFSDANNGDYVFKNEKGELESVDELLLPSSLNFVDGSLTPPTSNSGDIYVLSLGSSIHLDWGSVSVNDWVRYDGSSWNSITPQKGTVCYNKSSDLLTIFDGSTWSDLSSNTIYTANDVVVGDREVDLDGNKLSFTNNTDSFIIGNSDGISLEKISFQGHTVISGSNTLQTDTALSVYDGDSVPSSLWDFRNNGDIIQGKDTKFDLNDNKLTFDFDQSSSNETAPMNFEFGGQFGGYYSRWDKDGGLVIKSAAGAALKVVSKVDSTSAMFYVGKEGGGFMSTNNNRIWTIADETSSTTKNEFDDNRFSQYFAGTEYHRIQTGGGASSGVFFHMDGFGSLGGVVFGASSKVGTEDISLQGDTLMTGNVNMSNLPTSSSGLSSGDVWNDGGTLKIV